MPIEDRRRRHTWFKLAGTHEAARLFGVNTPNFIRDFTKRRDFPLPLVRLKCGPVWKLADLEHWKHTHLTPKTMPRLPDSVKLALIEHLRRHMDARDLTQAQMADLVGITQPRLSSLLQGKTGNCSTARLMQLVTETGFDVIIRVKPADNRDAKVTVTIP